MEARYLCNDWRSIAKLRADQRILALQSIQPTCSMKRQEAQSIGISTLLPGPRDSGLNFAGLKCGTSIIAGWVDASTENKSQFRRGLSVGQKRAQWLCFCTQCGCDFRQTTNAFSKLRSMDGCHECRSENIAYLAQKNAHA
jgi:hypothetical protein